MTEPFIGEIKMFSMNWAPEGWHLCDGTLLPVNQYVALYSLLSTKFGGDGKTTFGIPDLRGRVPVGMGASIGMTGGVETVALSYSQISSHNHMLYGNSTEGTLNNAANCLPSSVGTATGGTSIPIYGSVSNANSLVALYPDSIGTAGTGQTHTNMQPYTTVNFCIAVLGIYPMFD